MQILSQQDPRWSNIKLGTSYATVGRFGCTTTCISMLSDRFGCFESPKQIAEHIDWYDTHGFIQWPKLNFPKMKFVWRDYIVNPKKISTYLRGNGGVLLQVSNGQHWVLALNRVPLLNEYVCVDPWNGRLCLARRKYRNITGAAYFLKI